MTIHQVMNRLIGKQSSKCITFCIALVQLLDTENIEDALLEIFWHDFTSQAKKDKYMLRAKSQRFCKRKSWEDLEYSLSETQFQRYFRMSWDCFAELFHHIKDNIAPNKFKRETFIHKLEQTERKNSKTMVHVYWVSTGSLISGKIKIAILLRLLAGGHIWILLCWLELQPDTFTKSFIKW